MSSLPIEELAADTRMVSPWGGSIVCHSTAHGRSVHNRGRRQRASASSSNNLTVLYCYCHYYILSMTIHVTITTSLHHTVTAGVAGPHLDDPHHSPGVDEGLCRVLVGNLGGTFTTSASLTTTKSCHDPSPKYPCSASIGSTRSPRCRSKQYRRQDSQYDLIQYRLHTFNVNMCSRYT